MISIYPIDFYMIMNLVSFYKPCYYTKMQKGVEKGEFSDVFCEKEMGGKSTLDQYDKDQLCIQFWIDELIHVK